MIYNVKKIDGITHVTSNMEFATKEEAIEWLDNDFVYETLSHEVKACEQDITQAFADIVYGDSIKTITWSIEEVPQFTRIVYKASSEPSDTMRFFKDFKPNEEDAAIAFMKRMVDEDRLCFIEHMPYKEAKKIKIVDAMRFKSKDGKHGEFDAHKYDFYEDGTLCWCAFTDKLIYPLDEINMLSYYPDIEGVSPDDNIEYIY